MAEADAPQEQQQPPPPPPPPTVSDGLRYLDFVHLAAIQTLICFVWLYEMAKENAGPLKSGVQSVEGTVKAVIGPVYDKFHDVPYEVLKFVDRKVGDSISELERHVPTIVRKASTAAQKAPEMARSVAMEFHRTGMIETATGLAKTAVAKCEPTAKDLYAKYEPVAEHYAAAGWRSLHRLPLFPQVAQVVVPTAAYWSERYNVAVSYGRAKGYTVATYLLPVPTERIAKVFSEPAMENAAAD